MTSHISTTANTVKPASSTTTSKSKSRKRIPPAVQLRINFFSGIFSGVIQAGLLNPWDRALYLSVIQHRPFLTWDNFADPYRGFWQSVVQRTISGGTYFVLQGQAQSFWEQFTEANRNTSNNRSDDSKITMSSEFQHFLVGISAGILNGMLLNQLASVKYHAWNQREKGISFWRAASQMYIKGGISAFFKGCHVTGLRDMIFGCVYEVMRIGLRPYFKKLFSVKDRIPSPTMARNSKSKKESEGAFFCANMIAAACATVASGPFNFVRSIQYSTKPQTRVPSIAKVLRDLWSEVLAQVGTLRRVSLLQQRLRIGWGTARVGVGMAIGQELFDWSKLRLQNQWVQKHV